MGDACGWSDGRACIGGGASRILVGVNPDHPAESSVLCRLRRSLGELPEVSASCAEAYLAALPAMERRVSAYMEEIDGLSLLIGGNPLERMYDNHRNHGSFMAVVLRTQDWELLLRTLPWVYRCYRAHGFHSDYFPAEIRAWRRAMAREIEACYGPTLLKVYDWMLARHEDILQASEEESKRTPVANPLAEEKKAFQASALAGDAQRCMEIAQALCSGEAGIAGLYLRVIQPAMEEIGHLWEMARIGVADEHLATGVITRVMAVLSVTKTGKASFKGRVLVAAAPHERHEVGVWMLADLLERNGWQVRSLGADTPADDILAMLRAFRPDLLMLSATLASSIATITEFVRALRNDPSFSGTPVLVGGRAFRGEDALWRATGADAHALDLLSGLDQAEAWRRTRDSSSLPLPIPF